MRKTAILFFLLMSVDLAVGAQTQSFILEFDVAGMSCRSCAVSATAALKKIPDVTSATVDFESRRGRVEADREITKAEVRRALGTLGFEARFPGDPTVKPLTAAERARTDIAVASRGEAIDIRKQLAPGKITIFDFWAEWCGPCHLLTPKLERLVFDTPGLALRSVDIGNWDSPAAKQATEQFKMPALPYVRIYGADGKLLAAVVGNDVDQIKRILAENISQ